MWRWFSINIDDGTHFGHPHRDPAGDLHRGWVAGRRGHLDPHLGRDHRAGRRRGDPPGQPRAGHRPGRTHELRADILRVYGVPHKTGDRYTIVNEGLARWTYEGRTGYGISEYLHQLDDDGVPWCRSSDRRCARARPTWRPRWRGRRRRPGHRTAAALGRRQRETWAFAAGGGPDPPAGAAVRGAPHRHGHRGGAVAGGPAGPGAAGGGDRRGRARQRAGRLVDGGRARPRRDDRPQDPARRRVRPRPGGWPGSAAGRWPASTASPGRHPRPGRRRPGGPATGGARRRGGAPPRLRAGVPVAGAVPAGGRHATGSSTATSGSAT